MSKNKKNKDIAKRAEKRALKGYPVAAFRSYASIIRSFRRHSVAPTVQSAKRKQAAIFSALSKKRQEVYAQFSQTYGFDIPTQSQKNLARLRAQLSSGDYLPPNEQVIEGSCFTASEMKLFKTWKKLCADFSLFHTTEDLPSIRKDSILRSVQNRCDHAGFVNTSNTGGHVVRRNHVYCLLALGQEHQAPSYLKGVRSYVRLDIGKMLTEQRKFLKGLWVGSHLSAYYDSKEIKKDFDGTLRTVSYDKESFSKTITYQRKNGETIRLKFNYQDEIFSAENNLNDIFTGLFYYFILELRCLGDDFRKYVLANADDPEIISRVYGHLFQSSIYPEVSVIDSIDLKLQHVHYFERNLSYFYQAYMMHSAARAGRIKILQQLHELGVSYDIVNSDLESTIVSVVHAMSLYSGTNNQLLKVILFLLKQGVDIRARNDLNASLLSSAVQSRSEEFVNLILKGSHDPQLPVTTYLSVENDVAALEEAVRVRDVHLLQILLDHGARVSSRLLRFVCHEEMLRFLIEKGLNINVPHQGLTPIMFLLREKQYSLFHLLLNHNPDLSIRDEEGKTVLHYAAIYGGENELLSLIKKEVEMNPKDFFDRTPCDCIQQLLEESGDQEEGLTKNLKILQMHGGSVSTSNSPKHACDTLHFSAVALVTKKLGDDVSILMVRKADRNGLPTGCYMFPGGLCDPEDADFEQTAIRETQEETGYQLTSSDLGSIFSYEDIQGERYYRTKVYQFKCEHGTTGPSLLDPEIAERVWIKYSDIEIKLINDRRYYFYQGVPIRNSNGLLLDAVVNGEAIAQEEVQDQMRFEMYQGLKMALEAMKEKDTGKIVALLDRGLDINDWTYVTFAAALGDEAMVKFLLNRGADVNEVSRKGGTPLFQAFLTNRIDFAKRLIEIYHADVNQGTANCFALIYASAREDLDLFDYLCAHGASADQNIGGIALLMVIQHGNVALARKLVKMGVDLNRKYPQFFGGFQIWNYYYPLEIAVERCSVEIVKILLEHGASVYCRNSLFALLEKVARRIDDIKLHQKNYAAERTQWKDFSSYDEEESLTSKYFDPKKLPALNEILTLLKERASEEVEGTAIFNLAVEDANARAQKLEAQDSDLRAFGFYHRR